MMKSASLLWLALLSVTLAPTQTTQIEHAPTVEQCKADQRLWAAETQIEKSKNLPAHRAMVVRSEETGACANVDPENRAGYLGVMVLTFGDLLHRYSDFVDRRSMRDQFAAEDAAGKR
jgi:hypothetical protein